MTNNLIISSHDKTTPCKKSNSNRGEKKSNGKKIIAIKREG
jgi:hypothetical protein